MDMTSGVVLMAVTEVLGYRKNILKLSLWNG